MNDPSRSPAPGRGEDRAGAPLAGFEQIMRNWDPQHGCPIARLLPGEVYVSRQDEIVTTVLGSCIAACIRDPYAGVGGMNHFMLPQAGKDATADSHLAARFGSFAMEQLINSIMKHGGERRNLEIKLFGGGKMIPTMSDVGARNIRFVRDYLERERFTVVSEDLGLVYPRKVNYYPITGKAMVKRLRSMHNRTVADQDLAHLRTIEEKPQGGEVELF